MREIKSLEKQKDTGKRSVRRCETCQKRSLSGWCRVLMENIGKDRDCWAWTDDPDWERKFQEASKAYQKRWAVTLLVMTQTIKKEAGSNQAGPG